MKPSWHERAAAWLVTGPVGHLVAGLLDWLALLAPAGLARVRREVRRRAR